MTELPAINLLPARVLMTGATGLVGAALAERLRADGVEVVELAHRPRAGAFSWNPEEGEIPMKAWAGVDAVVHLAGETIAQRWSSIAKKRIYESRVTSTRRLAEAMAKLEPSQRPKVFLCASAIGIYGAHRDTAVDETSSQGTGFLAELVQAWEAAGAPAREAGIRTVNMRFGVVLARAGGAVAKMLPVFRLGLGGPIGSGAQRMSWMALSDAVEALRFLLRRSDLAGAFNLVSPVANTNRELAEALGRVLHRPAILPAPAFAMKLLFGEMAEETLLSDLAVGPKRLREGGFEWKYPNLQDALRQELAKGKGDAR